MKRNNIHHLAGVARYIAPSVEVVQLTTEHFTLASELEDYPDNPIFGSPKRGMAPMYYWDDWDE